MAWKWTSSGRRKHRVQLANPSVSPDGEGGVTTTYVALSPEYVYAAITQATAWNLERIAGNTVTATATHVVTFPYHAQVTTKTRITYNGRVLQVTGIVNPGERNIETVCVCSEVVA